LKLLTTARKISISSAPNGMVKLTVNLTLCTVI